MEDTTNESNASKESCVRSDHNATESCTAEDVDSCMGEIAVVARTSEERLSNESKECENIDPCVGMEFESERAAQIFYYDYAKNAGFKVRINTRRRSPRNYRTVGLEFVCSKEGFRRDTCINSRRQTRVGCKALLRVRKKSDSKKWVVVKLVKEHNHALEAQKDVPFHRSHGHLLDESGGSSNVFPLEGCRTFIQGLRKGILIKKIDAHVAEIDETVENPAGRSLTDSNEPSNLDPCVGLEFDSEEAATVFYFEYATRVGFGVRINLRRRSARDGATTGLQFVCCKEGFRRKECKNTRRPTREGCMAMIHIKKRDSGKWTVTKFIKDHCHALTPGEVPILRSYKLVSSQFGECGDTVLSVQGRSKKTLQDRANYIQNLREKNFGKDAQHVLDYFKRMQLRNASFFYAIQVDKEYHMTNVFWADAWSRMAYNYFGDVVTFDITCNERGMTFCLFLGSNHHKQPILFGCALLLDANEGSFVWLFNTWLEAMSGCHPISIVSNQDPVVEAAIKKVFPDTRNHYCKRDILKKIPEKLGHVACKHEDFMRDFSKCINLTELNDEFESWWKMFIDKYELRENEWLQLLYNSRERWVKVYSQDTSSVNMLTTRNDSTNSFSVMHINADSSLETFVDQCEKAVDSQFEKEFEEDFRTSYMKPIMKMGLPMENQAADIYTRTIFLDFQEQLFQSLHHTAEITKEDGPICTARVVEFGAGKSGYTVKFNSSEVIASCSCQMFEYAGILCRHVLRLFTVKNVTMLPSNCILKRWTRNSTNVEFDEHNIEVLDNAQESSWTLLYNSLYRQVTKYAGESSATLNIYYLAMRALRKALEEVDASKKIDGIVTERSVPVNGSVPEGNNRERNSLDNAASDVTLCDPQSRKAEGPRTTSNKPALEEQRKKKRKCQVCKHPNHDKRKCPYLRAGGDSSNVSSVMLESQHLHGGIVEEQFAFSGVIPGVSTNDYHFLRYV